ncbi:hypothetical protein J3E68DRAFT_437518 [Trichoderma sp. SZMC 28012]
MTKTMLGHLVPLTEDIPTPPPSATLCSTNISNHGPPINEAYYSSPEEGMSDSTPGLVHSDASTTVSNIKSLGAEDCSIDEGNSRASKETSDDESSLLWLSGSMDNKELCHRVHTLELDDDGDRDKAVAGGIKPFDTATTTQSSKLLHKTCATQARVCAEVRVGFGDQTPRWRRGSELSYVICEESFPTEGIAMLVKVAMRTATSSWKGIGVQFRQVNRHDEATFAIVYEDLSEGAYAVSFFPRASGGKLVLYKPSLSNTDYLANILVHEIGHILGLRHAFAHKREPQPSILIGRENTNSVMNYFDHLSKYRVTEQDLQELEMFYAYDEGELSIIDIDPKTRPFSPLCNSHPVPPVNPAAISATHKRAWSNYILIFNFFTLFMLFILFVTSILILFVHLH